MTDPIRILINPIDYGDGDPRPGVTITPDLARQIVAMAGAHEVITGSGLEPDTHPPATPVHQRAYEAWKKPTPADAGDEAAVETLAHILHDIGDSGHGTAHDARAILAAIKQGKIPGCRYAV